MGTEIEHKFKVRRAHLPAAMPSGKDLIQGYLNVRPAVRVRITTDRETKKEEAFITIKGFGTMSRAEYEYPIPVADAREMLPLCGDKTIEKIRRVIDGWEIDEFLGRHAGLWLAEYELKGQNAKLPATLPAWVGKEVTEDSRYANSRLSSEPFDPALADE